jgi:hypothetical protein
VASWQVLIETVIIHIYIIYNIIHYIYSKSSLKLERTCSGSSRKVSTITSRPCREGAGIFVPPEEAAPKKGFGVRILPHFGIKHVETK